jgi:STE24 endopeptidase
MQKRVFIMGLFALALPSLAAAQAVQFDPEAASQAYLATLKGTARAKSDAYFEGGYWLPLWATMIGLIIDFWILRGRFSAWMRDWAERTVKRPFLQSMLYALPYTAIGTLMMLPWTIYQGFVRENQYDLMNQSFGGWLGEEAINFGISLVMSSIVLAVIVAGIRKSPRRWWIWGTGFAAVFIGFFASVAPIFISPLFNTYSELKPGPVRDRIVAMATANHVPAEHIYVFDQSKQTKRVSANVSGLGPTIRISLNDNLLNRTTLPETASVMGHELGHYVLGHMWILIPVFSILFGIAFWFASLVVPGAIRRWGAAWGVSGPTDLAAIPVYSMAVSVALLLMTPMIKSTVRINESAADAFGLEAAREPDGFAKTALMLSEYRKIEPSPIEELLFYDHPSGATRIRMAMAWKAKHLAEVEARAK